MEICHAAFVDPSEKWYINLVKLVLITKWLGRVIFFRAVLIIVNCLI